MKKIKNNSLSDRLFLVEGARSVAAFLESPLVIESLIAIRRDENPPAVAALVERAGTRGIPVRWIDEGHARRYFETKTPQGIGLLIEKPVDLPVRDLLAEADRVLILDGVNDPGNAGTLIRTAHLLGWNVVLLTAGSVSPWGEKTVRASAGALGFIPTRRAGAAEIAAALAERGFRVFVGDPEGERVLPATKSAPIALILGSEAHGASALWQGAERIAISIGGGAVDSLGVAASGAILLEKLRRSA